jgi:hypothetical protein
VVVAIVVSLCPVNARQYLTPTAARESISTAAPQKIHRGRLCLASVAKNEKSASKGHHTLKLEGPCSSRVFSGN